jgi:hypothetical protein
MNTLWGLLFQPRRLPGFVSCLSLGIVLGTLSGLSEAFALLSVQHLRVAQMLWAAPFVDVVSSAGLMLLGVAIAKATGRSYPLWLALYTTSVLVIFVPLRSAIPSVPAKPYVLVCAVMLAFPLTAVAGQSRGCAGLFVEPRGLASSRGRWRSNPRRDIRVAGKPETCYAANSCSQRETTLMPKRP